MNNDLISREALKKKIEEVQYTQEFCIEHQIDYSVSMQMLGMVIDNAPTVDTTFKEVVAYECGQKSVERPTGHWFLLGECSNEGVYCSNCHKKVYRVEYANQKVKSNYCPNCGADMRGGKQ